MIQKEQFLNSLTGEIEIIKHLGEKITDEMLGYKPSDGQRTMQELMNYMGQIYDVGTRVIIGGDEKKFYDMWDNDFVVSIANFTDVMNKQISEITHNISSLTEDDFVKPSTIFGVTTTTADHLMSVLKWASAYKMQMFLYLKSAGLSHLNTKNLWAGMDTPANSE